MLVVRNLTTKYAIRGSRVPFTAVDDVSLDLERGEILGVVGESGSGKSTLGRSIIGLVKPAAGEIEFEGADLVAKGRPSPGKGARSIQMVFQDPHSSLDPRQTIEDGLDEVLRIHGERSAPERQRRIAEVLDQIGLRAAHGQRFPHELSGGQCQRVGIARALILQPRVMICDEAVSALDVIVQAQILNLLRQLRDEHGIAMIFITHDVNVVRYLADDVIVMKSGRVVERGRTGQVLDAPLDPYTRALIDAVPHIHR